MRTPKEIIDAVAAELTAAGIPVSFEDGWEDRGRPGSFTPQGVVCGVLRTNGVTRWPVRSMDTASVLLDVARVRHLGKLSEAAFSDLRDGEANADTIQAELTRLRSQLRSMEQKVDGVATTVASLV